jgi:hypothetical protein
MASVQSQSKLNFWELICINGSFVGFPGVILGGSLAQQIGIGAAIVSIVIGNAILWLIGLSIVSMSKKNEHAIENIKDALGKVPCYFAAIIWVFSFIFWYTLQIKGAMQGFQDADPSLTRTQVTAFGPLLGLLAALISLSGIQGIRKLTYYALPFMLLYLFYILGFSIFTTPYAKYVRSSSLISLPSILIVILFWIAATVNLPTVFRNSLSHVDSVVGLSFATIIRTFIQISGIFWGTAGFAAQSSPSLFAFFILISYLISNFLNIYFASAVWDTLLPKYRFRSEYFLVGLFGTSAYLASFLISEKYNMQFILEIAEFILLNFLSILGIVLVITYLIRITITHRERPFEKMWGALCWLIGCCSSFYFQLHSPNSDYFPLLKGIAATSISYLVLMFIEETFWSIRELSRN